MDYFDISHLADIIMREQLGELYAGDQETLDEWLGRSAKNREMYEWLTSGKSAD